MRVKKIRVQNYRSYRDSGEISVGDKLVLVGENNAGKSNILRAMEMFLDISPTSPHRLEDFHLKETEQDIEIGVWFSDFSEEEREIFAEYLLDDTLYVRTVYPFDEGTESVENKYFVVQKPVPVVEAFRGIDNEGADRVTEIYEEHEERLQPYRIDDWSGNKYKTEIVPTVENYLSSDEADWTTVEVNSPSGIKSKLRENLPTFQYFESDRDIEDETKTSTSALLGRLLGDVIESVPQERRDDLETALSDINQQLNQDGKFEEIKELERDIRQKLNQHVPVDELNLQINVPDLDSILTNVDVSVDDGVDTDISRMGSGLHTSFILACLWQLADKGENDGKIIFGLEEPENDLHPHAQRQLYDTLDELVDQEYQVFLSTHSAFLVNGDDIFDTARIEKEGNESRVHDIDQSAFDDDEVEKIRRKITPHNNEMFFARAVLLCEGRSEWRSVPMLTSMLHEARDEIYAFDRLGISLIEVNGKSGFKNFLKVANMYNIPSIVLMDNDQERDDGHEELVDLVEERATDVVELPDDFEHQFFQVIDRVTKRSSVCWALHLMTD